MTPDYPSPEVPVWTETFAVQSDTLDKLYLLMIAQGLFKTNWQTQNHPLVGGSLEFITVTAHGKIIKIPAFVISQQVSKARKIYAAINALVPQSIWDKLISMRETYMGKFKQ